MLTALNYSLLHDDTLTDEFDDILHLNTIFGDIAIVGESFVDSVTGDFFVDTETSDYFVDA